MDDRLREDCLRLFQACLAQIRSGKPGPSLLVSAEFGATLAHLCERLRAAESVGKAASPIEAESYLEFIVPAGSDGGRDGMGHLRKWLSGATQVVVCDPYLFQFRPTDLYPNVDAYAQKIASLFPKSVRSLDVYTNSYAKAVKPPVFRALKEGRSVRHFSSHELHDRFIIKDRLEAKMMGTSFGGFGSKFFALLDLPAADVQAVRNNLKELCPFPMNLNRGSKQSDD